MLIYGKKCSFLHIQIMTHSIILTNCLSLIKCVFIWISIQFRQYNWFEQHPCATWRQWLLLLLSTINNLDFIQFRGDSLTTSPLSCLALSIVWCWYVLIIIDILWLGCTRIFKSLVDVLVTLRNRVRRSNG